MQENDGIPASNGDVTHLAVTDAHATTGMIVFGNNPVCHDTVPLATRGRAWKERPGTGSELLRVSQISAMETGEPLRVLLIDIDRFKQFELIVRDHVGDLVADGFDYCPWRKRGILAKQETALIPTGSGDVLG